MSEPTIDQLRLFFTGLLSLQQAEEKRYATKTREVFEGLRQLLDDRKREWRLTGERFNRFESLGVVRSELAHSRFIASLLDPLGRHDQGCAFISAFVERLGLQGYSPTDLQTAVVQVESTIAAGGPDAWGRLDIVIHLPRGRVIAIENKVDADEQDDQILRYEEWLCALPPADKGRHILMFLTPSGRAPSTGGSAARVQHLCWSYLDLAGWLASVPDLPPSVNSAVGMYRDICREIGSTS